jgi:hypothetical protein
VVGRSPPEPRGRYPVTQLLVLLVDGAPHQAAHRDPRLSQAPGHRRRLPRRPVLGGLRDCVPCSGRADHDRPWRAAATRSVILEQAPLPALRGWPRDTPCRERGRCPAAARRTPRLDLLRREPNAATTPAGGLSTGLVDADAAAGSARLTSPRTAGRARNVQRGVDLHATLAGVGVGRNRDGFGSLPIVVVTYLTFGPAPRCLKSRPDRM